MTMIQTHQFSKAIAVALLILPVFGTLPAAAAVCHVISSDDSGSGSLRAAIDNVYCDAIDFGLSTPADRPHQWRVGR
jgi:hypothetical protein